ncbi:MAG: type II toxin-antitoxin system VapC family toxin [Blastocatellia bacterium]
MSSLVTDTHAFIWYSSASPLLSVVARTELRKAEQSKSPVFVPSIVVVELRYLVEKRTITEQEYKTFVAILRNPSSIFTPRPLDLDIAENLSLIPRAVVPDMPDRIIAATALTLGLPLVTRDHKIRALSNITTIW